MGDKKKSKRFLIILVSVVFGLLFYVWQHIQVVCMGYRINSLRKDAYSLGERNVMLKRSISRHTNYDSIEKVACRLNMVYPGKDDIVYIVE